MKTPIYRARPVANTHLEPEIGLWVPSIIQIALARASHLRAMQRVTFNGGRYQYEPSDEYKRFVFSQRPFKKHKNY